MVSAGEVSKTIGVIAVAEAEALGCMTGVVIGGKEIFMAMIEERWALVVAKTSTTTCNNEEIKGLRTINKCSRSYFKSNKLKPSSLKGVKSACCS